MEDNTKYEWTTEIDPETGHLRVFLDGDFCTSLQVISDLRSEDRPYGEVHLFAQRSVTKTVPRNNPSRKRKTREVTAYRTYGHGMH